MAAAAREEGIFAAAPPMTCTSQGANLKNRAVKAPRMRIMDAAAGVISKSCAASNWDGWVDNWMIWLVFHQVSAEWPEQMPPLPSLMRPPLALLSHSSPLSHFQFAVPFAFSLNFLASEDWPLDLAFYAVSLSYLIHSHVGFAGTVGSNSSGKRGSSRIDEFAWWWIRGITDRLAQLIYHDGHFYLVTMKRLNFDFQYKPCKEVNVNLCRIKNVKNLHGLFIWFRKKM